MTETAFYGVEFERLRSYHLIELKRLHAIEVALHTIAILLYLPKTRRYAVVMSESLHVTNLWCDHEAGQRLWAPGAVPSSKFAAFSFIWVRQGKGLARIDGKTHKACPGDVFLIQPQQTVEGIWDPLEPSITSSFLFELRSLPSGLPPRELWPVKRSLPADDILSSMLDYVIAHGFEWAKALASGTCSSRTVPPLLQSMITTILFAFISGSLNRPRGYAIYRPAPVQRVLQWMGETVCLHPDKRVTLEDLAVIAGVSPTHLCHMFHDHVGYPPLEVMYLYRLTRSLIGLRAGLKLESLAASLGFANTAHYVRRFKALFGKTPGEMRIALSAGYRPRLPKLPFMGT